MSAGKATGRAEAGTGHLDVLESTTGAPLDGPGAAASTAVRPRLARHTIQLADGHRVGVSVCGRGTPIVLVHGFTAEGMLYAQTLSRIVSAGFKVVAIDTADHGSTQGLPTGGATFGSYTRLLGRVIDELGINHAILAGHSMGGRLVTELAASRPERTLAVILLDAIVGEPWDRIVAASRCNPLLLVGLAGILAADSATTVPFLRDPTQAVKFARLARPMLGTHLRNPLHLAGPGISILRSGSSKGMLQKLGRCGVPVVAIHGDRDIVVPLATARSAAKLAGGRVVVVEGGRHSWLLKDPETLPAILRELLDDPASDAIRRRRFAEIGLPDEPTLEEIEAVCYEPGAPVRELTPELDVAALTQPPRTPRYRWHVDSPR